MIAVVKMILIEVGESGMVGSDCVVLPMGCVVAFDDVANVIVAAGAAASARIVQH